MSFLARLFINDRIINVQSSRIFFHQNKDIAGKPRGLVDGGLFTLVLELDGKTDLLHQMIAIEQTVEGYVRFYKRDGMSRLTDYEFKGTYIYGYRVTQTANGTNPALVEVKFSPGALRIGHAIYRRPWCDEEFDVEEAEPTPAPEQKPKVLDYYITDSNNNRIEEAEIGDIIYLNLRTRNLIGQKMDLSLENPDQDYLYEGNRLVNDTLIDYVIEKDDEKIELEVISPEISE